MQRRAGLLRRYDRAGVVGGSAQRVGQGRASDLASAICQARHVGGAEGMQLQFASLAISQ